MAPEGTAGLPALTLTPSHPASHPHMLPGFYYKYYSWCKGWYLGPHTSKANGTMAETCASPPLPGVLKLGEEAYLGGRGQI